MWPIYAIFKSKNNFGDPLGTVHPKISSSEDILREKASATRNYKSFKHNFEFEASIQSNAVVAKYYLANVSD